MFGAITNSLAATGSRFKDYLVYYDGPSVQTDVCGVGGTRAFDEGPGVAVVLLQGCPDVPSDTIATHELLHALGALPPGDPHPCPGDSGHPCDSPTDVLYPFASGGPLSSLVLDFNHDDYYGHSGSWPDIQDSLWLHHVGVPEEPLGRGVLGGRADHERPARRRLHGSVLDAVGPGCRRDAGSRPGRHRSVRALDGGVQRQRAVRAHPQASRDRDRGLRAVARAAQALRHGEGEDHVRAARVHARFPAATR